MKGSLKTGVKTSFEKGQLSQIKLIESFQSKLQKEKEESVDDSESYNQIKYTNKFGSFSQEEDIRSDLRPPMQVIRNLTLKNAENNLIAKSSFRQIEEVCSFNKSEKEESISSQKLKEMEVDHAEDLKISKSSISSSMISSELQKNKEKETQHDLSKFNLIDDKSPVLKSFGRRVSKRFPITNACSQIKDQDVTHITPQNTFQLKGGFFFALKLKKYANKLTSLLQSRRYLSLRANHLTFFNDQTIVPDEERGIFKQQNQNEEGFEEHGNHEISISIENRVSSFFLKMYNKFFTKRMKKTIEKIPLFEPSNSSKLLWDFLNMLSIAFYLIFFPLRIAFGLEMYSSPISLLCLLIMTADILVHLNTGFYDKGILVTERLQILFHFIKRRLVQDLISLIPFVVYDFSNVDLNLLSDVTKFLESSFSILFLIRIGHLSQIKKKIEERFYEKKTLTHFFSLFSLLVNTLYIAHLFSCAWIIVGNFKLSTGNTWMNQASVDEEQWTIQYLYSLYFLIITMTTVGYGDIRASNSIEHLLIIIIVLISSGVFSFSINQIGSIVQQMAEEREKVKQTLQVINNYMNKKNINMSLQQQIREYLEYYLKESILNDNETEDKTINMLSEPLKKQLMIEANKIALKDSPIFRNNFSEATITKTVALIQELRCTPEEVLFYEGDYDSSAIFFVQQGKVELFIDSYKSNELQITSLKVFSKGSSFGEISFFTGMPRNISIRSIDFTTLLMIKRQDFLNVVKESSDDYENFCKIKDSISFYQIYRDLGIKCISCNSKTHVFNDCPLIHYVPDNEKIVKIYQRPEIIERQPYDLERKLKFNTLDNLFLVTEDAELFLANNINYLLEQEWYNNAVERDEEDGEVHNIFNIEELDDHSSDSFKKLNSGGKNYNSTNRSQKSDSKHNQLNTEMIEQSAALPPDSQIQQSSQAQSRIKDEQNVQSLNILNVNNFCNFDTHSVRSVQKSLVIDHDDKKEREKSSSYQLGINELGITHSGIQINLGNTNSGSTRDILAKPVINLRKLSLASYGNQLNHHQGIHKQMPSCEDNLLYLAQPTFSQQQGITVNPAQPIISNIETRGATIQRQSSFQMRGNQYLRGKGAREKTLRATLKKQTIIEQKMNVGFSGLQNNWIGERKQLKKMTFLKKGGVQENQIQNTLLALQGMENILLQQNKSGSNNQTEFDILKNFEIYFPHNNIDVILFKMKKNKPLTFMRQKSLAKTNIKKLIGSATISTTNLHSRMSKMDMVLQKFMMSEANEEKDKSSTYSKRSKSFGGYKTPKQSNQQDGASNYTFTNNNQNKSSRKKNLTEYALNNSEVNSNPLSIKGKQQKKIPETPKNQPIQSSEGASTYRQYETNEKDDQMGKKRGILKSGGGGILENPSNFATEERRQSKIILKDQVNETLMYDKDEVSQYPDSNNNLNQYLPHLYQQTKNQQAMQLEKLLPSCKQKNVGEIESLSFQDQDCKNILKS